MAYDEHGPPPCWHNVEPVFLDDLIIHEDVILNQKNLDAMRRLTKIIDSQ